jgi:hypothetical protein
MLGVHKDEEEDMEALAAAQEAEKGYQHGQDELRRQYGFGLRR